ncbi:DNA replication/repair protein RecF [Candidatus Gracilibacteria bacterium]|nr:DNA replication/repair protein RecF [Candidatus Gracilibacteria bacterium]
MLQKINIINFRSIDKKELFFKEKNIIIGPNGAGKTNILQAISILFGNNIFGYKDNHILKDNTDFLFIEGVFIESSFEYKISFSYDKKLEKKTYSINGKKISKKELLKKSLKTSYFSPKDMNLFYLGPSSRRDFINNILGNIYPDYLLELKKYDTILKNRNKILKNIFEGKSKEEEIIFWDNKFIESCQKIYDYIIPLNSYLETNLLKESDIFKNENIKLNYRYNSKVDFKNIGESIKNYLDKNLKRDIILGRTHIGPHIDDFNIFIGEIEVSNFASRGELKSIILKLKLLEIDYIKHITSKTPLLLIDDFQSELDENHLNILKNNLKNLQVIYTSINTINKELYNNINI